MANPSGRDLEDYGQEIFTSMGLVCVHRLNQARLKDIDPSGPYSNNEHLEFDYLIPVNDTCLVGEIKGGTNVSDIESAYSRKFRRHYDLMRRWTLDERIWKLLGVPDEKLRHFRNIAQLRGFFITAYLQKYDLDLSQVSGIARCYKSEWDLLINYSKSIGVYAQPHFLDHFALQVDRHQRSIKLSASTHSLARTTYKRIASGDIGLADLYTFEISPYDLLPIARVHRRDELPDLSPSPEPEYQRALMANKLALIRKNLLIIPDFMFPNNILVVLSNDCVYSDSSETLEIPEKYGAVSVIDGQHRLFSYADNNIKARCSPDLCKIMVTAIHFRGANQQEILRYSARTFVEINTNQTSIQPTHLDAIAYGILGETHPRAIAAQVLLQANVRPRGSLYGLFQTNQFGLGKIKSTTVLSALRSITNLKQIKLLNKTKSNAINTKRRGYEKLFQATIGDLEKADVLIKQGEICLDRYFKLIKQIFPHDYPVRDQTKGSSLELAKMIAAMVQLLSIFVSEGLDWKEVKTELVAIKKNVMKLRGMTSYRSTLFDYKNKHIPGPEPSASDDFRFLNANRSKPTSIEVLLSLKKSH